MKETSLNMNILFNYSFLIYKLKNRNIYKPISISITILFSACTGHVPAPLESTTVIGSQPTSSQPTSSQPTSSHSNSSQPIDSQEPQVQIQTYKQEIKPLAKRYDSSFNGYICEDAPVYLGKSIGDGECVDLIKLCSSAPLTRFWKPGSYVFGSDIPAGTAIATFRKGKYPNKHGYHAAIYSHQDDNGIYAWDQWKGQPVHLRYILAHQKNKNAGNNASRYRVIKQH